MPLQQDLERYNTPRTEGELDLVKIVRDSLVNAGLLPRVLNFYDNDRFIIEGRDKTAEVQRFLLNRYWSHQLLMAEVPSHEERYCLIPNGAITDWLNLFHEKILPFIIQHNLPA